MGPEHNPRVRHLLEHCPPQVEGRQRLAGALGMARSRLYQILEADPDFPPGSRSPRRADLRIYDRHTLLRWASGNDTDRADELDLLDALSDELDPNDAHPWVMINSTAVPTGTDSQRLAVTQHSSGDIPIVVFHDIGDRVGWDSLAAATNHLTWPAGHRPPMTVSIATRHKDNYAAAVIMTGFDSREPQAWAGVRGRTVLTTTLQHKLGFALPTHRAATEVAPTWTPQHAAEPAQGWLGEAVTFCRQAHWWYTDHTAEATLDQKLELSGAPPNDTNAPTLIDALSALVIHARTTVTAHTDTAHPTWAHTDTTIPTTGYPETDWAHDNITTLDITALATAMHHHITTTDSHPLDWMTGHLDALLAHHLVRIYADTLPESLLYRLRRHTTPTPHPEVPDTQPQQRVTDRHQHPAALHEPLPLTALHPAALSALERSTVTPEGVEVFLIPRSLTVETTAPRISQLATTGYDHRGQPHAMTISLHADNSIATTSD